ncbi:MAG: alanine racemase, partial [Elusimicrobiota bacterium]|nr:alanine racemase [Elusimicrobiota bacterium]
NGKQNLSINPSQNNFNSQNPSNSAAKKKNSVFFRQSWIEIDKSDYLFNLKKIREFVSKSAKIMPVLKSNGYGHGLVELGRETQNAGFNYIAVFSLEEGIELREAGVKTNILILDEIYPFENLEAAVAHDLTPTISTMASLMAIEHLAVRLQKRISFHLEIDTGMGRAGASPETAFQIIQKIAQTPEVSMTGMFTHFSVADTDPVFTKHQLKTFLSIVKYAHSNFGLRFIAHAANSAAIFKDARNHLDMVRPGIAVYGISPFKNSEKTVKLKPVLTWKTKITLLKKVPSGAGISYGRTFVTNKSSQIAIIPVGYGDGYNRLLSNQGEVLIRGKRCPIAGRITMNMTMIDATGVKGVSLGDEVVLIGSQGKEQITADEIAKDLDTISYEVLCAISPNIPRILV